MAGIDQDRRSTREPNTAKRLIDLARNAALLLVLWFVYSWVRSHTSDNWTGAYQNATGLLSWQQAVGLPSEAIVQDVFLSYPRLIKAANRYYMWVHFPLTGAFLIWTWFRHYAHFKIVRATLVSVTVAALGLHILFPLAPPRFMTSQGFVDTGLRFGPSPYELSASQAANQIAAMPSLHVGWALLVALSVIAISKHRLRYLILIHPLVTFSVVVVTANHYWSDGFVAAALVLALWALFRRRYVPRLNAVSCPDTLASLDPRSRLLTTTQVEDTVGPRSDAGESSFDDATCANSGTWWHQPGPQ